MCVTWRWDGGPGRWCHMYLIKPPHVCVCLYLFMYINMINRSFIGWCGDGGVTEDKRDLMCGPIEWRLPVICTLHYDVLHPTAGGHPCHVLHAGTIWPQCLLGTKANKREGELESDDDEGSTITAIILSSSQWWWGERREGYVSCGGEEWGLIWWEVILNAYISFVGIKSTWQCVCVFCVNIYIANATD